MVRREAGDARFGSLQTRAEESLTAEESGRIETGRWKLQKTADRDSQQDDPVNLATSRCRHNNGVLRTTGSLRGRARSAKA